MENTLAPELETLRYITYDCQERLGYITLNRPDKRNALNADVVTELKQAFEYAENDNDCKVIILRAHGEVFCAGADWWGAAAPPNWPPRAWPPVPTCSR